MNELEKYAIDKLAEAMKEMHPEKVVNVMPGTTYFDGGQHIHLEHTANPEEVDFEEGAPSDQLSPEDKAIVDELTDVFYSDRKEATDFLAQVRRMTKPTEITQLVTRLVEKRKISDKSCCRPLWTILHKYGLYAKSEANWNQQIKPNLNAKR